MLQEDKFDWILFSMAQEHEGGMPDLLDTIFGFLARKTDFYVGGEKGAAEKLLLKAFRKYEVMAAEEQKKKKLADEEAEPEMKEKLELQKEKEQLREQSESHHEQSENHHEHATVTDVADEEAEKLGKEMKNKKTEDVSDISESEAGDEKPADSKKDDYDVSNYNWTQTLQDIDTIQVGPENSSVVTETLEVTDEPSSIEENYVTMFLEKWNLDTALAEEIDQICKLGVLQFSQLRNPETALFGTVETFDETEKHPISETVLDNPNNGEDSQLKTIWEDIQNLIKRVKISKTVLISRGKEFAIESSDFSSTLAFALHSLGSVHDKIEYKHMLNMLVAKSYFKKSAENGISVDVIMDLRTILLWKLEGQSASITLSQFMKDQLEKFVEYFNASLQCVEGQVLLFASAAMLTFLQIGAFERHITEKIAQLVFNVIVERKAFPTTIFPIQKDEKFKNAAKIAKDKKLYKHFMMFTYECCRDSLKFYLSPLKKEIDKR